MREIGPVGVEDEASQCAMEAADGIKEEGTEVMPIETLDPPEIGGVEAMRTDKVKPSRSVGTVARKATRRASAGRRALIQREPYPDPVLVPDKPRKEIESDHTTPKDPEKPEKGQPS